MNDINPPHRRADESPETYAQLCRWLTYNLDGDIIGWEGLPCASDNLFGDLLEIIIQVRALSGEWCGNWIGRVDLGGDHPIRIPMKYNSGSKL